MTWGRKAAIRGLSAGVLGLCAACGSAPVLGPQQPSADRLVVQASTAARRAYELGDYAQARSLYARALTRARAIDSAGLAADAAYNLAMAEIGLGDYPAADQLLREAEYDAIRAASSTADILLVRAKVAYLRERPTEAAALANELVASAAAQPLRLQAMILRGQIYCDTGALPSAKSELQAIKELVASASVALGPSVQADVAKLEGTIARLEGRMEVAARFFDAEAELLRAAQRYRDMGYALARVADAYLAAGHPALAADRFFLAARSLDARGDVAAAQTFLASSMAAAEQAGDEHARARARVLLEEISQRAGP